MTASDFSSLPASAVRQLEIGPEHAGQRIDNYLINILKGAPKTLVYRLLRKGEVRVNKGRIKPNYRLQEGDIVRIPPVRLGTAKSSPKASAEQLEALREAILQEDDDLLILNKPAGMAVHGGSGLAFGVIEGLRQLFPQAKRLELVHRLDKDTSGCLLVAKKASALKSLHTQIREKTIEKEYLTLLKGVLEQPKFSVELPLRKNVTRSGERIVTVDHAEGKSAHTDFFLQQQFADAALVKVVLHTGRTHQIRVHSAQAGHPIAGDAKYGQALFNRQCKQWGLRRIFLHARRLQFSHPATGQTVSISAPLPADLKKMIETLEQEKHGL
jgi:23S rRNA pseudouridine955/2504/2580 synthase